MLDPNEEIKYKRYEANLFTDLRPLIKFLDDDEVTDIHCLCNGNIKIEKFGREPEFVNVNLSYNQRMRIIHALSTILGKPMKYGLPKLEAHIPKYEARFTAMLPPWTSSPTFTIRRPPSKIYSLESYLADSRITREQYEIILDAINSRKNILVGGATGSGKTTFLNAILSKMVEFTPNDRFIIIEDTPELLCKASDVTFTCGSSEEVLDIVRTTMRWTVKRIIFGELRFGSVANELLKIWSSGHSGNATTIHAGSAVEMISRLKGLLREVIPGELPKISLSIQLCVHLKRDLSGPKVSEVLDTNVSGIDEYAGMLSR